MFERRPPLRELGADERHHQLAVLVGGGVARDHQAPAGPAGRLTQLHDLAREGDRVARIDRLRPAQLADAGRGAVLRRRLAARPHVLGLAQLGVDEVAHVHRGRVPARGAQPAEMRARRGRLVEMEKLRIEAARERLDLLRRKRVAAELGALADAHVLEVSHAPAFSPSPADGERRPRMKCGVSVITRTSSALSMSRRALTKPISGRLFEARLSITCMRTRRRSPGRPGGSHFTSPQPVAPIEAESSTKPSAMMRIMIAQLCQPEAHRPPTMLARAASSSRCIGCGSNSAANALISSAVTSYGPYSVTWPGAKSSQ